MYDDVTYTCTDISTCTYYHYYYHYYYHFYFHYLADVFISHFKNSSLQKFHHFKNFHYTADVFRSHFKKSHHFKNSSSHHCKNFIISKTFITLATYSSVISKNSNPAGGTGSLAAGSASLGRFISNAGCAAHIRTHSRTHVRTHRRSHIRTHRRTHIRVFGGRICFLWPLY